jgi:hypothetical protein
MYLMLFLLVDPIKNVQNRDEVQSILMKKLNDLGTVLFLMKNLTRNKEGGFEWKMNLTPIISRSMIIFCLNISFSSSLVRLKLCL